MPSSRVVGSAAGAVVGYERHHTTRACSADDASIRAWAERHLSDSWPYRASLLVFTASSRRIMSASAWRTHPEQVSRLGGRPARPGDVPTRAYAGSGDPKLTNSASGTSLRILDYLYRL